MTIESTDIHAQGSTNMQDTDSGTQGGVIDEGIKVVFTDISANDTVEILSSSSFDAFQVVTITGRNNAGLIVTEDITLSGTSPVSGVVFFESILKIVVEAGGHFGIVTIRKASDNVTIATLLPAEDIIRRIFYNVSSGSAERIYYEKIFVQNHHGSLTLLNPIISEYSDGMEVEADITFDLEDTTNGNNTSANRLTAPSSGMLSSFSDAAKVSPGNLGPLENIGVWLKLTLPPLAIAQNTIFSLSVDGDSV